MSVVAPVHDLRTEVFLERLVSRLHEEYGADREDLRTEAVAALALFASARVQAFVPILVEKRLREACRGRRAARPGARPRRFAALGEGVPVLPVPPGVRALRGYRRPWLVKD